jgi:hypothetical protein
MTVHRIGTRRPAEAPVPRVEQDAAVVTSRLTDAAHVEGGFAAGRASRRRAR